MISVQLVMAERARHLTLGYNAAHDASHANGELSRAALARLLVADYKGQRIGLLDTDLLVKLVSPWNSGVSLLNEPRLKLMVEAAALLLAEIERILPPPTFDECADERAYTFVALAIGTFARATGSVSRIADPEKRRKILELLDDYADLLAKQVAVELAELPVPEVEPLTTESV